MRRREFISMVGAAIAVWPAAAPAQQSVPVVGYLFNSRGGAVPSSFLKGLAETGYFDGQNVTIDYRSAEDQNDRLPALVLGMIDRGVDVIVADGSSTVALAAKAATQHIPIVFIIGGNPTNRFVDNLARPGRNMTGITVMSSELSAKRLELLHELIPAVTSIALLVNPTSEPTARGDTRYAQLAAKALGIGLHVVNAGNSKDIELAFSTAKRLGVGALLLGTDNLFFGERRQIIALAMRHAMPTMYASRASVLSGGLISYTANDAELLRQAGLYTGRILKGEKPADLPVQQPTKLSS